MKITLRPEHEKLYDDSDCIREKIERAFGQFDRGEFFSAEESRADMEETQGGVDLPSASTYKFTSCLPR